jgi:putative acetyltransferase
MSFLLRVIKESDNFELAKVIKTSLEQMDYALDGTVYTDEATDHMFDGYQTDDSVYYIAEVDGKIMGGAGIRKIHNTAKTTCELQRMFLSSEARGLGIGSALMKKCLDFAREKNYELVYLETAEIMKDAIKLYQKSGFKMIDHAIGNTGHFSCPIRMTLALNQS